MWDKIKKAINSDLSKPLNTFIQEIHNSWATQRGRLDANISSRATDAGVWTGSTPRFLGMMGVSNTVLHSAPNEVSSTYVTDTNVPWVNVTSFTVGGTGGLWRLRYENAHKHHLNVSVPEYCQVRLVVNGVHHTQVASTPNANGSIWTWQSHNVWIPAQSAVTVQMRKSTPSSSGGHIHIYLRNFQLCGTGTNAVLV